MHIILEYVDNSACTDDWNYLVSHEQYEVRGSVKNTAASDAASYALRRFGNLIRDELKKLARWER